MPLGDYYYLIANNDSSFGLSGLTSVFPNFPDSSIFPNFTDFPDFTDFRTKLIPIQRAFFNNVEKAQQQGGHKYEHLYHTCAAKVLKIYCPWVHKYYLDIKQYKKDSNQEIFNWYRCARITDNFDTRLKRGKLIFGLSFRADFMGYKHGSNHKT